MSVAVLGAGAFGTSLAIAMARSGKDVTLWARDVRDMADRRENTLRLPGFAFPDKLVITEHMPAITDDVVLLAVPMQKLRAFLSEYCEVLSGRTLVATCKGIDVETGDGDVVLAVPDPGPYAVNASTGEGRGSTVVSVPQTRNRDDAASVVTARSETGDVVVEALR